MALLASLAERPHPRLGRPAADPIATSWWVDFWSGQTSLANGRPAPVGVVVRAYDPTGVLAGVFTVTTPGWYGLMPVCGDAPLTPEDEGAQAGATISFSLNGFLAQPRGPEAPTWTTHGDRSEDVPFLFR